MRSCLLLSWLPRHAAFSVGGRPQPPRRQRVVGSTVSLAALTERQMQFWEDVDAGLDDIDNFYAKKGQDIDRIRTFAKT